MRSRPLQSAFGTLSVLICSQFAHANSNNIKQITIYQGKAAVERELALTTSGEQQVVFGCLSGNLDPNSIQIHAPNQVNIGEINVQTLSGEQAKLCQRQGNQGLTQTQDSLDRINAKITAQEAVLAFLQNFGKTTQLNHSGNIQQSANQIAQTAEQATLNLAALRQQKAQLDSQLASDMNAGSTTANRVTQISVRIANRSPSTVTLNYLVNGASWQPQYQAGLDTAQKQLKIDLQAVIAQTTGENWQNVAVVLSTAEPSYNTSVSDPQPDDVHLYDPNSNHSAKRMSEAVATPMPVVAEMAQDSERSAEAPLPSYQVSHLTKGDLIEYRLAQKITIPSDGRRINSQLDSQTVAGEVWLRSVPQENLAAYWFSKAPQFNKNWVDGEMRLYRDNHYVGSGQFNTQLIRQNGLGFGINNQLIVTQLADETKSDNTGVFGSSKIEQRTQRYRFENQMAQPIVLEVVSGIPVAQDGQINIKSGYDPTPSTLNWQDKKGLVAWRVELQPQQSQIISQSHELRYPKDKILR